MTPIFYDFLCSPRRCKDQSLFFDADAARFGWFLHSFFVQRVLADMANVLGGLVWSSARRSFGRTATAPVAN